MLSSNQFTHQYLIYMYEASATIMSQSGALPKRLIIAFGFPWL